MNDDPNQAASTRRSDTTSPRVWFWVVSAIALVWYLMDTSAFLMRVLMLDDIIEGMQEDEQSRLLEAQLA